jgi:E3 ubiquitin-protein ligase UBR7
MSEFNINEDAQSGGEFSGSQSSNNEPASSSSQQPNESAFPDEDEETITMLDVIEREDKLEEEASAVLGNSDEKNCTYPKGYVPRQALYSCATCSTDPNNMAAICLACSLECHDNHEVIELYTKRNYRCDCGNSKFKPDFECKLMDKQMKKTPLNELNKYNHNFNGRYCICDKKYPPDESDDSIESLDEMLQCIVCEDWYHTKHLGIEELPSKFDELICETCADKLDFVRYYSSGMSNIQNRKHDCVLETLKSAYHNADSDDQKTETTVSNGQFKSVDKVKKGPIFWTDCSWRSLLCKCPECLSMYKEKECEYLLDDKDTVQYYEAQGRAIAKDRATPYERGMSALNQMNRAAVVEALHGYDELKADLSSYLRKFADTKKVVREEDIHDFFAQLKSKKRPRLEYE